MVYRPTVRFDDSYKGYVEELFHATHLDRNQIHRLALFLLGFTHEGKEILEHFKKPDVTLPSPPWKSIGDYGVWLEQTWEDREKDRDVTESESMDVIEIVDHRYPIPEEGRHAAKERGTGRVIYPQGPKREVKRQEGTIHSRVYTPNTGEITITFG